MIEIYIVRHAETLTNVTKTLAGVVDIDLSEKGEAQLKYLAEFFRDKKIDKVYLSPLTRTRKTANAVNKYSNATMIERRDIIEMNVGSLEGKKIIEMSKRQLDDWNNAPHQFTTDAESMADVYKRSVNALKEILSENRDNTIAIVTHGGVTRNLMCYIKGLPHDKLKQVNWGENAGVFHIFYNDDNTFSIDYETRVDFIPKELRAGAVGDWVKK